MENEILVKIILSCQKFKKLKFCFRIWKTERSYVIIMMRSFKRRRKNLVELDEEVKR